MSNNHILNEFPKSYCTTDLYNIIQVQKKTIDKLMSEVTKKSHTIPKDHHEKALNELETERYEHSKTKLELLKYKDIVKNQKSEISFFKNELEKERSAYANVFDLLKDKALNESTKSIDLISKIAETEIKYNDAMNDINRNEEKYALLCQKIKSKEKTYEKKMQDMNLKVEQDKFIKRLINESGDSRNLSLKNKYPC